MKPFLKILLTTPTLAIATPLPAQPAQATPATQPATQPAPIIAQSNVPLVIPDGTSLTNPGPAFTTSGFHDGPMPMIIKGLRG